MGLQLGVVDISCAFTQSHTVHQSQRCIFILPWYLQCPWTGRMTLEKQRAETATMGMITTKPIYGTTCAPLRCFCRISETFKLHKWKQCSIDPCVFRRMEGDVLISIATIHVGEIFAGCQAGKWESCTAVINEYQHSGLQLL